MTAPLSKLALLGNAGGNFSALNDHNLIATLLILVLGMALGIGLICLLLVVYFLRTGRLAIPRNTPRPETYGRSSRWQQALGPPNRWLAIRSGNPFLVQRALGLYNVSPCSWEEGLGVALDHKLFISPPVGGWILVFGANLPDPSDDIDRCFRFLLELSRKAGHVQFFSVNRVVHHHAWAQLDQGRVLRAYAWAGRTLWNQGRQTRAEVELRLKCYDYTEPTDRFHFTYGSPASVNTERVPLLAARWSVDPAAISSRMFRTSHGLAGTLWKSKTH